MSLTVVGLVELSGQRRGTAAAKAVPHHQYLFDLELRDRKFQRRGHAVKVAEGTMFA